MVEAFRGESHIWQLFAAEPFKNVQVWHAQPPEVPGTRCCCGIPVVFVDGSVVGLLFSGRRPISHISQVASRTWLMKVHSPHCHSFCFGDVIVEGLLLLWVVIVLVGGGATSSARFFVLHTLQLALLLWLRHEQVLHTQPPAAATVTLLLTMVDAMGSAVVVVVVVVGGKTVNPGFVDEHMAQWVTTILFLNVHCWQPHVGSFS